jgi:segregation and condensation protein A
MSSEHNDIAASSLSTPELPPAASEPASLELGYTVTVDNFSGPLDLLLYLVRRTELDILEVPLALIVDQFIETVESWQDTDLDSAGDFILMAATLLEMKARTIVPPEVAAEQTDSDEPVFDPREGLLRSLLTYRKFKEAIALIDGLEHAHAARCERQVREIVPEVPLDTSDFELGDIDLHLLMTTCERVLSRINGLGPRTVIVDEMPLSTRLTTLIDELRAVEKTTIAALLANNYSRIAHITTVMASLELARQRVLEIAQRLQFDDVELRLRSSEERERVPELPPEENDLGKRKKKIPLVTFQAPPATQATTTDDHDDSDKIEDVVETDEQRFLRELEESTNVTHVLARTADVEKSFIQHWYTLHPELIPPPVVPEIAPEITPTAAIAETPEKAAEKKREKNPRPPKDAALAVTNNDSTPTPVAAPTDANTNIAAAQPAAEAVSVVSPTETLAAGENPAPLSTPISTPAENPAPTELSAPITDTVFALSAAPEVALTQEQPAVINEPAATSEPAAEIIPSADSTPSSASRNELISEPVIVNAEPLAEIAPSSETSTTAAPAIINLYERDERLVPIEQLAYATTENEPDIIASDDPAAVNACLNQQFTAQRSDDDDEPLANGTDDHSSNDSDDDLASDDVALVNAALLASERRAWDQEEAEEKIIITRAAPVGHHTDEQPPLAADAAAQLDDATEEIAEELSAELTLASETAEAAEAATLLSDDPLYDRRGEEITDNDDIPSAGDASLAWDADDENIPAPEATTSFPRPRVSDNDALDTVIPDGASTDLVEDVAYADADEPSAEELIPPPTADVAYDDDFTLEKNVETDSDIISANDAASAIDDDEQINDVVSDHNAEEKAEEISATAYTDTELAWAEPTADNSADVVAEPTHANANADIPPAGDAPTNDAIAEIPAASFAVEAAAPETTAPDENVAGETPSLPAPSASPTSPSILMPVAFDETDANAAAATPAAITAAPAIAAVAPIISEPEQSTAEEIPPLSRLSDPEPPPPALAAPPPEPPREPVFSPPAPPLTSSNQPLSQQKIPTPLSSKKNTMSTPRTSNFWLLIALLCAINAAWGLWTWINYVPKNVVEIARAPVTENAELTGRPLFQWTFNMDVVDDKGLSQPPAVVPTIEPALSGRWYWDNKRTLTFEPDADLPLATAFTATLKADDWYTAQGFSLAQAHSCTWTTPALSIATHHIETFSREGTTLALTFNQAVNPAAIAQALTVEIPNNTATAPAENTTISADLSADPSSDTAATQKPQIKLLTTEPTTTVRVLIHDTPRTAATVRLAAGTNGIAGPRGLATTWEQKIALQQSLILTTAEATVPTHGAISLAVSVSDPAAPRDLIATRVRVEPEIPVTLTTTSNGIALSGAFIPGETYTISSQAVWPEELADRAEKLPLSAFSADSRVRITIPARPDGIWSEGSALNNGQLSLHARAITNAQVVITPANSNEAVATQELTWSNELPTTVPLAELSKSFPAGAYRLRIENAEKNASFEHAFTIENVAAAPHDVLNALHQLGASLIAGDHQAYSNVRIVR